MQTEVFYTPHFIRMYAKLDKHVQEEIKEKIRLFANASNHKSLKVHKLAGLDNTFSFSVNHKTRIVFEYGRSKKVAHLLYVGSHDEVY